MGFEDIDYVTRENRPSPGRISYMRSTRKSKQPTRGLPELLISIPTKFTARCKAGDKFKIAADHTGRRLAVLKAADGIAGKFLKHTLILRFGFVPYLGDEIADSEEFTVEIVDQGGVHGWEFAMPNWFKACEEYGKRLAPLRKKVA